MLRTLIAASAAAFLFATPALASHCPKDAAAIDAALASMSVPDDVRAEVVALRDEGMAAHEAGNHAEAEATLADAMRRLLLSQ
jgi:hypothetical protein